MLCATSGFPAIGRQMSVCRLADFPIVRGVADDSVVRLINNRRVVPCDGYIVVVGFVSDKEFIEFMSRRNHV